MKCQITTICTDAKSVLSTESKTAKSTATDLCHEQEQGTDVDKTLNSPTISFTAVVLLKFLLVFA